MPGSRSVKRCSECAAAANARNTSTIATSASAGPCADGSSGRARGRKGQAASVATVATTAHATGEYFALPSVTTAVTPSVVLQTMAEYSPCEYHAGRASPPATRRPNTVRRAIAGARAADGVSTVVIARYERAAERATSETERNGSAQIASASVPEHLPEPVDADAAGRVEFEPQWLRAIAFGSASAVATFGAVGLAAAVAGIYRSYVVFPLGAIVWIGLLALARPILAASGAVNRRAQIVSAGAVLFAGAISFWNARHASQHVLINRDPGAYANAGRWIALHGSLRVTAAVGPFLHRGGLTFGSFAMYPSGGRLSFQFAHLLPALLAEAHDLGGDRLMFAATPALGGAALLAFFVAAWRLLRDPLVALAALVAFAFLLPEVSFSRDAFSEIPMQVLLFTGLWIFADRHAFRRPRVALVAGLLLGLLQAVRIDALVVLTGLALLFAVMWTLADGQDRRSVGMSAGACAVGLAPGLALGFTDVSLRSHQYLHDLRGDVRQLGAAMLGSILVAFVVAAAGPAVARRFGRVPAWAGWIVAAIVAAAGFGAWLVRPAVQHVHGAPNGLVAGLQQAAKVTVDPTRSYAERSMVWMSWYLGPIAVAAAIVAAALLVRALVHGRMWFASVGIALLAPASAVYLWRPNISTDQIWVMRRFLFSALPLLTLLAFGLVAALRRAEPRRTSRAVTAAVAVVIGAAGVAYPIWAVHRVPNVTEQRGDLLAVREACRTVGRDAAIVVLQNPTSLLSQWVPQTLRGWCDTPVAVMQPQAPGSGAVLGQLATRWSAAGRRLWVIADTRATIQGVLPSAEASETTVVVNPYLLERTVLRRPGHYVAEQFSLVMARVLPR